MSAVWWHECDIGRASLNVGEDCVHCGLTYAHAKSVAVYPVAAPAKPPACAVCDGMVARAGGDESVRVFSSCACHLAKPPPTAPTPTEMPCARCGIGIPYRADEVDPTCNAMDCCRACYEAVLRECWESERAKVATLTTERDALRARLETAAWLLRERHYGAKGEGR